MKIGFAAKAVIISPLRFGRRGSWIAFNHDMSALAIAQNISLCALISLRNFLAITARTVESAVQFFGRSAFLVEAPGVIG